MKKWDSSFAGNLLLFSAGINFLSGLFHLFHHIFLPFGLVNFGMTGLILGFYFFMEKARQRFEWQLEQLHRVQAEAREAKMDVREFIAAQEVALKTLLKMAKVVGAIVMLNDEAPTSSNPGGVPMEAEVCITIKDCEYIITYGSIRRYRSSKRIDATCYHSNSQIPPADLILSALLLLKNDPTIFDRWARQDNYYS